MQLVLDSRGMVVAKRNNCFFLKTDTQERLISPLRVSSIAVMCACNLSSSAILLAAAHQIPIYFMNAFGEVVARLGGASYGQLTDLRRAQATFADSTAATDWCVALFVFKCQAQAAHLTQLAIRCKPQQALLQDVFDALHSTAADLKQLQGQLTDHADTLRGKEGSVARQYWQGLAACLPAVWQFESRNRQPAQDPFNAALNYLYGMLYGVVETALFSAGLDPYLGVLHADQYGKPVLSYDLIEPFRPWIDQLLMGQFLDDKLKASFFDANAEGVRLNKAGKQVLIPLFHAFINEKTEWQGAVASRRNHINRQAGVLREVIEGTKD